MKTKPLLITVVILGVIAGIAYWIRSPRQPAEETTSPRIGQPAVGPEILSRVSRVEIESQTGDEPVILERTGNRWRMPAYYNLPADFSKLESLTKRLQEADVARFVTRNPERLARLDLGKSIIRLYDGDELIETVELGDTGQNGGVFVRFGDSEAAFLLTSSIWIDADQSNWPLKKPLDLNYEEDIQAITLSLPDGETVRFAREVADSEFTPDDPALAGRTLKPTELSRFANTLLNARFTDVRETDHADVVAARENAREFVFETFTGDTIALRVGRKPAEPIPADESAESGGDTDGETGETGETEMTDPGPVIVFHRSSDPAWLWNDLGDRAAFVYSDYIHNQMPDDLDAFFEPLPEPEPEEADADADEDPAPIDLSTAINPQPIRFTPAETPPAADTPDADEEPTAAEEAVEDGM